MSRRVVSKKPRQRPKTTDGGLTLTHPWRLQVATEGPGIVMRLSHVRLYIVEVALLEIGEAEKPAVALTAEVQTVYALRRPLKVPTS